MSRKHKPKLGQNFLSDLTARQRIVDALGDVSGATVVEIGPGHGAITELLASRVRRLIAIELDRSLVPELRFRFRNHSNVEIVAADVLRVELAALVEGDRGDGVPAEDDGSQLEGPAESAGRGHVAGNQLEEAMPVHLVGNLPYYITSDILLHLFRTTRAAPGVFSSAVLMMQREVAERVASPPGRREFGLLSATAQMHAQAEMLFTLGPESFSPPPEVESTVLRLRFHSRFAELGVQPAAFDRFLHQAFAQKRKTLAKNLRQAGFTTEELARAWPESLDAMVRAEASSLEDLAALHRGIEGAKDRGRVGGV